MSTIYDSISIYKDIPLSTGRRMIRIKKLTIKEYLVYSICRREWVLNNNRSAAAFAEIIENCVIPERRFLFGFPAGFKSIRFKKADQKTIIEEISKLNTNDIEEKDDNQDQNKDDTKKLDNWLIYLIAELGRLCGYSKDDVMGLYITEAGEILKHAVLKEQKMLNYLADQIMPAVMYAYGGDPKPYREYAAKRDHLIDNPVKNVKKAKDLDKIESEYLAKYYGNKVH